MHTDPRRPRPIHPADACDARVPGCDGLACRTRRNRTIRENSWQQSAITSLETECELLQTELGPRILTGPPRSLDALEARFQKFKWTYVQCYLSAHARWLEKMERLALAASDARRYFDALARLNAIAALGRPEGAHLGARVADASARVVRCELTMRSRPRRCRDVRVAGFSLARRHRRRNSKMRWKGFAAHSRSNSRHCRKTLIDRFIRNHDREHRLEGFLKITQAAQTDALVRVLDEKLARYLAQVLEENGR